jgi:hypothetical protein
MLGDTSQRGNLKARDLRRGRNGSRHSDFHDGPGGNTYSVRLSLCAVKKQSNVSGEISVMKGFIDDSCDLRARATRRDIGALI